MNENNYLWDTLLAHAGNNVEIAVYTNADGDPLSVTLEDMDTGSVILDAEIYTLVARTDFDSPEYQERIYQKMQHQRNVEDAERQVNDFLEADGIEIDDPGKVFDYEWLASLYEDNHDCNVADNDQWQELIKNAAENAGIC